MWSLQFKETVRRNAEIMEERIIAGASADASEDIPAAICSDK